MTVGEKIKQYRKEKGYTQKELGEKCGMHDSAIRRIENGGKVPKIETIQRIAQALDVYVADLDDRLVFDLSGDWDKALDEADKKDKADQLAEMIMAHLNDNGIEEVRHHVQILSKADGYRKVDPD